VSVVFNFNTYHCDQIGRQRFRLSNHGVIVL